MPRLPWIRRRIALPEAAVRQVVERFADDDSIYLDDLAIYDTAGSVNNGRVAASAPHILLTEEEAQWVAQRHLLTNVLTRVVIPRMFLVNSCTPYMLVETVVTDGLLPGMAESEVPQASAPTESITPSIKSMLPERWNVQAECPKRRIVVED